MKAIFVKKCKNYKTGETNYYYKYKGYEYFITFDKFGQCIDGNIYGEIASAHKSEQNRIDRIIEEQKNNKCTESCYSGFELFWRYLDKKD